jgi:hypothetical protein
MALIASDAADRVDQLTILVERLTGLVAEQCRCFEQHRPIEAAKLMEETSRLANLYRHEATRIRAEPALVMGAPAPLRQRLMQAAEAFDAVLHRHGRAVDAARFVTEGLVRAIAEEVASQREQLSGYGPTARPPASSAQAATAITLNRRA